MTSGKRERRAPAGTVRLYSLDPADRAAENAVGGLGDGGTTLIEGLTNGLGPAHRSRARRTARAVSSHAVCWIRAGLVAG